MLGRFTAPSLQVPRAEEAVWRSQVLLSLHLPSHSSLLVTSYISHGGRFRVEHSKPLLLALHYPPAPALSVALCFCLSSPQAIILKGGDFHGFFLNAILALPNLKTIAENLLNTSLLLRPGLASLS